MTILEINIVDCGSTGKIMMQIAQKARLAGMNVFTVSSKNLTKKKDLIYKNDRRHLYINTFISFAMHLKLGRLFGLNGFFSFFPTLRLIHFIKKNNVNLIHLHNLHAFCFNIPLLFRYIKKTHIPVIWTLHDCWSFTGRCPYFDMTKCDKWKIECNHCPYPQKSYPRAYIDTTRIMWNLKRKWFTRIDNCTIVTPSQWLADLVKQSYLKDYPVKVINNGIDLSVFKPTASDFREKHGLESKKVVLGVAFGWSERKGLDVFIELAHRLPDIYRIVLVGTDDNVDKQLPVNIISIHRTQNQKELAEIYTVADVFANPTREENYPTVNMECLACGTPIVTFKTGGSPEIVDETCGVVVPCDDIDAMEIEIRRICEKRPYSMESCLKRTKAFDMNNRFAEYVDLYKDVME